MKRIIAQDLRALASYVDVFAPMTYHQLTDNPATWIADIVKDVQQQTSKRVVPVVQTTDQSSALRMTDFINCLSYTPTAGVILFHAQALLEQADTLNACQQFFRRTQDMEDTSALNLHHNSDKNRFEASSSAGTAVSEYMKVGNTLIFTHTEVPEALEGQGIGGKLAKAALEYVRDNKMSAAPLCPFVKGYIERHPEYKDLVRLGG